MKFVYSNVFSGGSIELYDNLYLTHCAQRQSCNAHCAAGMGTRLAESCLQQLRSTVNHLGLRLKIRSAVHKAYHLDYALHAVKITNQCLYNAQAIAGALLGGSVAILNRGIFTQTALERQLTVDHGKLTRGIYHITGNQTRNIGSQR